MSEAAELVRQLAGQVFEGIRIDGIENNSIGVRELAQFAEVIDAIPRKVRRHRRRRTSQLLDHGAVLQLLEDVSRFTCDRETRESRTARTDAPARNRDGKALYACSDSFEIHSTPRQYCSKMLIVGGKILLEARVVFHDQVGIDWRAWRHRNLAVALARECGGVAGVDVEDVAGRLCRSIGRKKVHCLGDVLGRDVLLEQAPSSIIF